jgi:hypothetical protein
MTGKRKFAAMASSPATVVPRKSRPRQECQAAKQTLPLTDEEIRFVKNNVKSVNDPAFILCPNLSRVQAFVSAVNDNMVPNIPPPPPFIVTAVPLTEEYDSVLPFSIIQIIPFGIFEYGFIELFKIVFIPIIFYLHLYLLQIVPQQHSRPFKEHNGWTIR